MAKSHQSLKPEAGSFGIQLTTATKTIVHHRLPNDHPAYELIGRVAAEAAQLEHILDITIWDLSGLDAKTGSCLTTLIQGYHYKLRAISSLTERHGIANSSLRKRIGELLASLRGPQYSRNRYVHDAWFIQEEDFKQKDLGQFKSFTPDEKKFGFQAILEGDIEKAIEKVRLCATSAGALRNEIDQKLRASREKPARARP